MVFLELPDLKDADDSVILQDFEFNGERRDEQNSPAA